MADDSLQSKMGRAGESLVINYYNSIHANVKVSIDQYDSNKDLVVDDQRIEVKTQVPFINKDAFTFKKNQLRKCLNADKVIFVSVPNKQRPHFSAGKAYVIESASIQYSTYRTRDGRDMVLIPIKQDGMMELFTMSDKEGEILQRYSISGYN